MTDLVSPARPVRFGPFELDARACELRKGPTRLKLPDQSIEVLKALLERPGELVTRGELRERLWSSDTVVDFEHGLNAAVRRLRAALGDSADAPTLIETLPRRGYRFIGTIEPASAVPSVPSTLSQRSAEHRDGPWSRSVRVIASAAIVVLTTVAAYFAVRSGPPHDPGTQVARLVVLPFENLGSPDDEYFADGMTDEITARLAGLAVIARQSAVLYKKSEKTPQEIGDELGADYLLEATVSWQRGPEHRNRIRIRPQLIRTSDAIQVWADVYEEDVTETFAVQTRIANRVVEGLDVTLLEGERRSMATAPTSNTEAHDYYLRGLQYLNQSERLFDVRKTGIAVQLFEKAIALDPRFAHAHAALSRAHWNLYWFAFDRGDERLAIMKQAADRAIEVDPDLPEGRIARALSFYARFEYSEALNILSQLQAQQPYSAEVALHIGAVLRRQGRLTDAAVAMEEAARLNPRSPLFANNLGLTYLYLRNFGAAEHHLSRAAALSPDAPQPYVSRASNFVGWKGATRDAWIALLEAERFGLENDPLIIFHRIWLHLFDRDFEKAAEVCRNASVAEAFDWQYWFVPRAQWLGEMEWQRHQPEVARAHFETARPVLERRVERFPADPRYHSSLGVIYAGLGRGTEAVRSARKAVALLPMTKEALRGAYAVEALAWVQTMTGDRDAAVGHLADLMSRPNHMSSALLRLDPRWDPLRGHPGFEQLLNETER